MVIAAIKLKDTCSLEEKLDSMLKSRDITLPTKVQMATHSSTLAWKIPWMEELGGLQSVGSLRVGYD